MLELVEDTATGLSPRFALSEGVHPVGRDPGSALILTDPSVSRRHAEISVAAGSATIRDLGSRNGTWINEQRIDEPVALRPGDRIRFGTVRLWVADAARTNSATVPPAPSPEGTRSSADLLSDEGGVRTFRRLETGASKSPESKLLKVVTDAGRLLLGHQPLADVYETVLDLIGRVVEARRILILLSDREGEPPMVRAARPAAGAGQPILLSRTLMDTVLGGRESLIILDAQTDERFRMQQSIIKQEVHAALVAPLFDQERVIGLVYADSSDPRVVYDEEQLRVLSLLANLIAVKITTTRLLEAQQEMERIEQELATAARIQRSLLPALLPDQPGYEIRAFQEPCRHVGGDLYDVARLDDGRVLLVLGDVCGKGMGAALLMANVLASLRLLAEEGLPLVTMVERLHRQMMRTADPMRFVTLFLARLDPRFHCLEYVNAGHPQPLLCLSNGEVRELETTGPPVGLLEDMPFGVAELELPPDALLCAVSDGIPEAQVGEEFFGDDRLRAAITSRAGRTLAEIEAGLKADLAGFLAGEPASDDITLLLIRRRA